MPVSNQREIEKELLQAVLRLWGASRMENRSDFLWAGGLHEETLGMAPHRCHHENCPNTGRILTPPVFSAQMEIIMTAEILRPAKEQILQLLRDLMQGSQRQSWFTIYLALFILLHSCAMMTANNIRRARKHGIQVSRNSSHVLKPQPGTDNSHYSPDISIGL